jgi:hypothetical protein
MPVQKYYFFELKMDRKELYRGFASSKIWINQVGFVREWGDAGGLKKNDGYFT